ncbi:MAG TPA: hypothetical protein VJV79_29940 [Polyangiaceae bacterium]|nr:hypothetical protein [Polyangiaceae bacterium]
MSIFEIAGKLTSRTFAERKAAAQAILSHACLELPDPDTHLARDIFGYTLDYIPMTFGEGTKAMAQSPNVRALVAGIADLTDGMLRRVSVPKAHGWRLTTEGKWVKDLTKIQRDTIPKFAKWEKGDRKKPVPRLKGQARDDFLASTTSIEWASALVMGCQERALLCAKKDKSLMPTKASAALLSQAIDKVACYCAVYTRYLIKLLTDGALPKPNDSGDIELFLYATDDTKVVVTSEKKWVSFATDAGFGNRVLLV